MLPKAVVVDASALVDLLRRGPEMQRYEELLVSSEALRAPLLTTDRRLARTLAERGGVEVLGCDVR